MRQPESKALELHRIKELKDLLKEIEDIVRATILDIRRLERRGEINTNIANRLIYPLVKALKE